MGSKSIRSRFLRDSITLGGGRFVCLVRDCRRPLRLIRARCKGPVQSVFADRVEDLVRKNERPAIHCRSALVAQERREVSAGIRSREGRSERNGSGVLVCDGRPHILGADILGAAEVPGSFSDH